MKYIFLALSLLGLVFLSTNAQAAEFRSAASDNGSVVLSGQDTVKDLYTAADTVTISVPVQGDLVAAGATITVANDVQDSLFAAGNSVTLRGTVGRAARIAGREVIIDGTINGDLLVAGQQITISDKTVINGDLIIGGTDVIVNGTVKGLTKIHGTNVALNGTFANVSAYVDNLTLNGATIINGDLLYRAPTQASVNSSAKITGQTNYTKAPSSPRLRGMVGTSHLLTLLGVILLLLLLTRFWPKAIEALLARSTERFGSMLLWGLGITFITPIILVLVAFTLIGLPFALLGFLVWLAALMIGSLIGKLVLGSWVVKSLTRESSYRIDWQVIVVGVLLAAAIGFIPVIGGLITFVLTMVGLGATFNHVRPISNQA